MSILVKNINIFSPSDKLDKKCDLLVIDGKINKIEKNIEYDAQTIIDGTKLTLLPGLVDMHTHLREPGQEYKEDIVSGTKAAAKGGFTSIACMANTSPVNDSPAITASIVQRAKEDGFAKVYPVGAITKGLQGKVLSEMGLMSEAGCVAFSDDGVGLASSKVMYNALEYVKHFDKLLISHCETDLAEGGSVNEGIVSTKMGLKGINHIAEELMVYRDAALAKELNTKVHIAHISTKESVEIIRKAKAEGVQVTCETCPHYIAGTEEMALTYDTSTKVNPPLRTNADRLAIIEGIVDGTIDAIVTDHAPHHVDDKLVEYQLAANGISGIETSFGLCYTYLVKSGEITLSRLVELMCVKPASILGINAGTIAVGADADFTIVDLEKEWTIDVKDFASKGKNNPFDGWKVQGLVMTTVCDGKVTYQG